MPRNGEIGIRVGADTTQATKDLKDFKKKATQGLKGIETQSKKTGKSLNKMTKQFDVKKLVTKLGALTAAVGGVAVGVKAFTNVLGTGKALQDMAMNTGIATEKLEEFRVMTGLLGGDIEDLSDSVLDFTEKMGEAAFDAESSWAKAFRALGVELHEGVAPAIDDTLRALAKMVDEGKKSEAFFAGVDLFGDAFKKTFAGMISEGIEPFEKKLKDLQKLKVFDAGILSAQKSFREMFNTLKVDFGGFLVEGVSAVLPQIESILRASLSTLGFDLGDMTKAGEKFGDKASAKFSEVMESVFGPNGFMKEVITTFFSIDKMMKKTFNIISGMFDPNRMKTVFTFMGNILKQKLGEASDFLGEKIAKAIDPTHTSQKITKVYADAMNDINPTNLFQKIEKGLSSSLLKSKLGKILLGAQGDGGDASKGLDMLLKQTLKARREVIKSVGTENEAYKILNENFKTILRAQQEISKIREEESKTTQDVADEYEEQNKLLFDQLKIKTDFAKIDEDSDKAQDKALSKLNTFYTKYIGYLGSIKSKSNEGDGKSLFAGLLDLDPNDLDPVALERSLQGLAGAMDAAFEAVVVDIKKKGTGFFGLLGASEEQELEAQGALEVTQMYASASMEMFNTIADARIAADQRALQEEMSNERKRINGLTLSTNARKKALDKVDKEEEKRSDDIKERNKKLQIANAWIGAASGIPAMTSGFLGAFAKFGMAGIPLALTAIGSATAIALGSASTQQAAINSYATGGIVGGVQGASMGPDNTVANVRQGEAVMTANMQREFLEIARGNSGASAPISIVIEGNVTEDTLAQLEDQINELRARGRDI